MALEERIREAMDVLEETVARHPPAVLATSLGAEDMVLTDMVAAHFPGIGIFTLDTGRLNPETYDLLAEVRSRYGREVRVYFPDAAEVEAFVGQHGPNAFYESVGLRKTCCHIRKVAPLKRALAGRGAWITGLRQEQSPTRQGVRPIEWDGPNGLYKANPLWDWTAEEVWAYLGSRGVPYNRLHDQGYASVGCAPCTRPIGPGEDIRAGRWWWESPDTKECGLHPVPSSLV
ncbi:MAG: phosphoadenylyl-sulfate reductase [Candidatus Tectomicrobia bacterium]|uniref:Adenosine 5'-phosphosulfate reductase n=1 Tax=Tectimicrobiota bacterium TaxID=2528274 RepID=A0A932HYN1_UNCTE|nr:phosphoadenylyl-sulfate reductase [Candidatus Tectomicrobia bacterium]